MMHLQVTICIHQEKNMQDGLNKLLKLLREDLQINVNFLVKSKNPLHKNPTLTSLQYPNDFSSQFLLQAHILHLHDVSRPCPDHCATHVKALLRLRRSHRQRSPFLHECCNPCPHRRHDEDLPNSHLLLCSPTHSTKA